MRDTIARRITFVDVPPKRVEFENGESEAVKGFSISQRCVTIELFDAFIQDTGYRTTSELLGGKSYQTNELVEHFSEIELPREPAFCLSYLDARSFCDWADLRLPREAEWLAASLIDDEVYETGTGHFPGWCGPRGAWPSQLPPNVLEFGEHELTADIEGGGRFAVLRCGPKYYRHSGWRKLRSMNRWLQPVEQWDLVTCFRVCRI